jgi:UDP-N-acetylmuramate dehydrogenase
MSYLEKIEGIQKDILLSKFTTFQVGGTADYYYAAEEVMKIPSVIEACRKDGLPFIILGWGSNIVFSDKGFRGLVVHNLAKHCEIGETVGQVGQPGEKDYRPAGRLLRTDSGTLLSQVIQFALKNGLTGMEKLTGVPGTIGGAVRGNAGAYGVETKHLFEKALIYKPDQDELTEEGWDYMGFDYRNSKIKTTNEVILKIALRLIPGDPEIGMEEVRKTIASRAGKHPQGRSAGSFFKNPSGNSIGEGLSAGLLIDQAGYKGKKIGGAFISEKHSNFLMSDGTATLMDIMELSLEIQKAVWKKFQIRLVREVALVGEHGYIPDDFEEQ